MDPKKRKKEYREKEQKELIFFIIILIVILIAAIFIDKKFKRKIEFKEYDGEVQTYDGSLQRNISNPLGFE